MSVERIVAAAIGSVSKFENGGTRVDTAMKARLFVTALAGRLDGEGSTRLANKLMAEILNHEVSE